MGDGGGWNGGCEPDRLNGVLPQILEVVATGDTAIARSVLDGRPGHTLTGKAICGAAVTPKGESPDVTPKLSRRVGQDLHVIDRHTCIGKASQSSMRMGTIDGQPTVSRPNMRVDDHEVWPCLRPVRLASPPDHRDDLSRLGHGGHAGASWATVTRD
jgi:hypothetical protein